MLAKRIIPTILTRGSALVKGERYRSWRTVGVAAQAVRIHDARQVDEILLLDVAATADGRGPNFGLVSELAADCFGPLAVGGGIRNSEDVRRLLRSGADKIVLGTAAVHTPELITQLANEFGRQAVVVSVDVRDGCVVANSGALQTAMEALCWCRCIASAGAGEIILSSVERDGTMQGYDLKLIRSVSRAVTIPVIASGGCCDYENMHQALRAGADAVAAGALFQFTDATPAGAAQYLHAKGWRVRL